MVIDPQTVRSHWSLDPYVTFLNHGSFGACPREVLTYQQTLREQLESDPVRFFVDEYEPLLDVARQDLATFVGAETQDLVFVPNATTGINTVLRSLSFQLGEELLTTNHEYNASRNALEFVAARSGAIVTVAEVPFPIASPDQVIDAILNAVTPSTRLLLIDHVSSQTGLILPVEALVAEMTVRGIEVLIDGAHAPGMVPLNLQTLGAAYYTGNCHKWLCAPKGAAFLYVRRDRHSQIRPLVISHGANTRREDRSLFHLEFDWTGTGDPTPYLAIPKAIEFMEHLIPGGWDTLIIHNHHLAIAARQILCSTLDTPPPAPDTMLGALASVPLPDGDANGLYRALCDRQFQVPIVPWPEPTNRLIRISAQIYNSVDDYQSLAETVRSLLQTEA